MDAFFKQPPQKAIASELHLSAPALRQAWDSLNKLCQESGGIDIYIEAITLKFEAFQEHLANDAILNIDIPKMTALVRFMPSVRRRIGEYLLVENFAILKGALIELLSAKHDEKLVDARIATFCDQFPKGKRYRWVRDLAAEVLHNTSPELYPPMQRYVWDNEVNAGVIREIWIGDIDRVSIDVPDNYATFLALRIDIASFLRNLGIYQNSLQLIDLIIAQIYAQYVAAQGGSYLRADFSAPEDGIMHLWRMLGLDGGKTKIIKEKE